MAESNDDHQRLYFPNTVEEAIEAIRTVEKWKAENPEHANGKGVISTNQLFLDMFERLLALEAMVKGGAAIKREKNVRKNV